MINISFPANSFVLYEELISLATYEILPTSEIFPLFMDFPDYGAFNDRFDRLDYGSFYSVMVLGCVFIAFCWMLLLYVIYVLF